MKPIFSIVVPVYKVEPYIHQCVDSILSQSYSNFELILVDDGSPDNCPAICDKYAEKDNRIVVIHKENGGITSARLAGAQRATGDYVCCIDSDDWISSDYLAKFACAIEDKAPDIVCCGSIIVRGEIHESRPLRYHFGYYSSDDIQKKIYHMLIQNENAGYFVPCVWGKAYKRELYLEEQEHVNVRIQIGEDGAVTIPCVYRAKSLYILSDSLYYYRVNMSSITRNKKAFSWEGPKLIAEHLQKRINLLAFDFQEQWYRKTVHELYSVVVSQFYRKESYFAICRDIKLHLKDPIYAEAIKKARFKGFAGRMALFAMKYKVMWLIKLWSVLKK